MSAQEDADLEVKKALAAWAKAYLRYGKELQCEEERLIEACLAAGIVRPPP